MAGTSSDLLFRERDSLTVCVDCQIPLSEFLNPEDKWRVRLAPTPGGITLTLTGGRETEPLTLLAICPNCTQDSDTLWPRRKG